MSSIEIKPLSDFLVSEGTRVFQQAETLPQFFKNNLLNSNRVVVAFYKDPNANIRVFYFQYLRLCFEAESDRAEFFIRKIQQLLNNKDFQFCFLPDDPPQLYNDRQFKSLIVDFFRLISETSLRISQAIDTYQIMDTVFIYLFRSLLLLSNEIISFNSEVERYSLFNFLADMFSIDLNQFGMCISFVNSDVFVYEESSSESGSAGSSRTHSQDSKRCKNTVYMAYVEENKKLFSVQEESSSYTSTINKDFIDARIRYSTSRFMEDVKAYRQPTLSGKFESRMPEEPNFKKEGSSEHGGDLIKSVDMVSRKNRGKNTHKDSVKEAEWNSMLNTGLEEYFQNQRSKEAQEKQDQRDPLKEQAKRQINVKCVEQFEMTEAKKTPPFEKLSMIVETVSTPQSYSKFESNFNCSDIFLKEAESLRFPKESQILPKDIHTTNSDPWGLNVTKQFTNSMVMKAMTGSTGQRVRETRQRARRIRRTVSPFHNL